MLDITEVILIYNNTECNINKESLQKNVILKH